MAKMILVILRKFSVCISLDTLTVLVGEKYHLSYQNIISKARNRTSAEVCAIIALLATDHTLNEVSIYLGREISTMSKQVKNLRNKMTRLSSVREKIERLIEEISAISQQAKPDPNYDMK